MKFTLAWLCSQLSSIQRFKSQSSMIAGSKNDLYEDFSRDGDYSQYCNITEVHSLGSPTMEYLASLHEIKAETGETFTKPSISTVILLFIFRTHYLNFLHNLHGLPGVNHRASEIILHLHQISGMQ